jgi:hypothetical protein
LLFLLEDFKQALRVVDSSPLPEEKEAEKIRVDTVQRISGKTDIHWDSEKAMDVRTRMHLGYSGVLCRINCKLL